MMVRLAAALSGPALLLGGLPFASHPRDERPAPHVVVPAAPDPAASPGLPLFNNPFGTRDFVRRFVHAAPITKVFAFGGDTVWPTGVVGYALQARQWLTRALEAEVAAGDLTERSAAAVARRVMYGNQDACFDLASTRAGLLAVPAGHREDESAPRSS